MQKELCTDVQVYILTHYALSHAPLVRMAYRSWADVLSPVLIRGAITGVRSYYSFVQLARHYGNNERLLEWIQSQRKDWNQSRRNMSTVSMFGAAARGGHERLMRQCYIALRNVYMLVDVNWGMRRAARGGHERLVRICADEWGASQKDSAMAAAARGGHESIVRLCYAHYGFWGPDCVNQAMTGAIRGGHERLVRICIEEYGTNEHGRKLANEYRAKQMDLAMAVAAAVGNEHFVRLCHDEWGATDIHSALQMAVSEGHSHIVDLCKKWGASLDRSDTILCENARLMGAY